MNNIDKQYLLSIRSIFEFEDNYSSLPYFLEKLSDRNLAYEISIQFCIKNYGNVISLIDEYLYDNSEGAYLFEKTDIRLFDFESIENESIDIIKKKIGIEALPLKYLLDGEGNKTNNLGYWNFEGRFLISINKPLADILAENLDLKLDVKKEVILVASGYYTKFTIQYSILGVPRVEGGGDMGW